MIKNCFTFSVKNLSEWGLWFQSINTAVLIVELVTVTAHLDGSFGQLNGD